MFWIPAFAVTTMRRQPIATLKKHTSLTEHVIAFVAAALEAFGVCGEVAEVVEPVSGPAAFPFTAVETFRSSRGWRRREWSNIDARTNALDVSLTCQAFLFFTFVAIIDI
jgi:hypothetical protein